MCAVNSDLLGKSTPEVYLVKMQCFFQSLNVSIQSSLCWHRLKVSLVCSSLTVAYRSKTSFQPSFNLSFTSKAELVICKLDFFSGMVDISPLCQYSGLLVSVKIVYLQASKLIGSLAQLHCFIGAFLTSLYIC